MLPGGAALCNLRPMLKHWLIAAALVAPALALTPPRAWEPIPDLPGTDYIGRSDANGELVVAGWRSIGGQYVSDDLHSLAFIAKDGRIGLMTDIFRHREADGAAAWTVKEAMSFTADAAEAYIDTNCGAGPGFEGNESPTDLTVGIVPMNAATEEGRVTRLYGAAKVDLKSGTIQPLDPTGIVCLQEELH